MKAKIKLLNGEVIKITNVVDVKEKDGQFIFKGFFEDSDFAPMKFIDASEIKKITLEV